ncbi:holo-ACP synthase [Nocardia asteroides]|uniref:Holo-[acyl-carrier-protein] synthase n=1 Tax=Nocardia asteroides NBRC 15531 TaxID=1110697 RepID=U5EQE1_NOCAS|nr:holo-ACP synthase [Nocardia asteroides]TLF63566.1 holo-[acyl-carrier-protein] synthase [Nocardia asteroides NBRC 15531]UGT46985.1 holo-ACP synthase [Nocardia asteroides]SFM82966.1 holo-[acyl-carrier protein] synthase [Nocardia asteroides]VEG34149.1 Holo-[acyl-carrier-protein] synthase [Nocardia asteroides]GAD87309.1 holo-[acyl-carrier-protein] synthase [Nocardia asteroides NBRC 15531]
MTAAHVGVDLVFQPEFEQVVARHGQRFLHRVFTDTERAYCAAQGAAGPASLAARFAAKEATFKALASAVPTLRWREIETVSRDDGRPVLRLHEHTRAAALAHGCVGSSISLSHDGDYAIAMVALHFTTPIDPL